jgi:DNA replication and repair protein RecF
MKSLVIRKLALTNFKNYAEGAFHFGNKFNTISGLNGIGKTNLLDALYYLCVGKSYFTPHDQKVVRKGEPFFRLESEILKGEEEHQLIIKVKPGSIKEIVLDHVIIPRISEHLGFLPVVFSAPKDIDLVYGPSTSRRRYMDHLLCQIDKDYLRSLSAYNHLLEMRNAALKQGFPDLSGIVSTYDDQIAPLAAYIFEKRKWVTGQFIPLLRNTYSILAEEREDIDMQYESSLHEYPYEVLVDQSWELDKNSGRSTSGIHRDDFNLSIKRMSAKDHGSQGQIKSLIFALHLTKYTMLLNETGVQPILILDDIFDKLDDRRLHRLIEILSLNQYGQIFISDTSSSRVNSLLPDALVHSIEM